jgi:hypothetical protein
MNVSILIAEKQCARESARMCIDRVGGWVDRVGGMIGWVGGWVVGRKSRKSVAFLPKQEMES